MRPRRASLVLLAAGLSSAAASAQSQVLFADDFESGQLIKSDGGRWDYQSLSSANPVLATANAAHRGSYGFELVDSDPDAGARIQGGIGFILPRSSPEMFLRFWLRANSSLDAGDAHVSSLNSSGSAGVSVALQFAPKVFWLEGEDVSAAYTFEQAGSFESGHWHLVELSVAGFGTDAGARTLRVDGREAAHRPGIDLSGAAVLDVQIGEWWSDDCRWIGTLDFDDVRVSDHPPATSLKVAPAGGGNLTTPCVPLTLSLVDASGQLAEAPYDVLPELAAAGTAGSFFSGSACSETAVVRFPAGSVEPVAASFLFATNGTATITATHGDFLSGETTVASSSTRPAPSALRVGCACADAGGGLDLAWLLPALLALTTRARGSRAPRRAPGSPPRP